jgi:hypothetical protein
MVAVHAEKTLSGPTAAVGVDVTGGYSFVADAVVMSTATVAPTAVTERRDGQTIEVAFSGRFGFGIYRWAYLPFDVPAGVRQIRVTTSHEGFALGGVARNVLDLGIFGPAGHELGNAAGFRGWSGGARDGFVISSVHATPGYLAGPIEPGRAGPMGGGRYR